MLKSPIRITLATAAFALAAAGASAMEPRSGVKLRALDKITGAATDLTAKVGETIQFGRLNLTVRACFQAPPEETPESAAFLEIMASAPVQRTSATETATTSGTATDPAGPLFSGWMFASSPGLSALEHPTYDVWVISCSTS